MVRAERFEVSREDDGDGGEAAMHAEYNNPLYETGTDSRRHNQQLSVVKPKAKPATRQGLAASAPRSRGISKGRIRGLDVGVKAQSWCLGRLQGRRKQLS
ncbi:hypothetical protein E4U09_004527 [Claviceps aff. purpurea]|uniref:Uncharacterized protein n=1 Tax=Claviceps aff. purpurea TaxID=1967640 RepID=A0A9P7QD20_9HYPO|nr:hypothetical protein E4U09_004527 [Claviceps aff. purpurea]